MYKVMLVDDDYPVIELLSETIEWDRLGLCLIGSHENGQTAWEHASREMPDILITDIGMPKMNGLELSARIKERKPGVRIAILSCHNEFQYAQQAMRLNVQDYLLKDALDPADLAVLLWKFKEALDQEAQAGWERSRMRHLQQETQEIRKERLVKNLIHHPLVSPEDWRREASEFGLFRDGLHCLPVAGYIDDYRAVQYRFFSGQTLQFALGNVLNEVLPGLFAEALHVGYGERTSLVLFGYKPGLQRNIYDEAEHALRQVQETLRSVLKIRMSFAMGEPSGGPEALKTSLKRLLEDEERRFYLEPGTISRKRMETDFPPGSRGLFAYYDEASTELREILIGRRPEDAKDCADRWVGRIRRERYPLETVKDWTLKLLLDLKLKLHAVESVRPAYSADSLHKEIVEIDSLAELRDWLAEHLERISGVRQAGGGAGTRAEVLEACKYVSLRLHSRISLDEVAAHLHLNASYFSRLFKKETGVTFIEYVTRKKMERAKELLDQTGLTVGEICEQLGYDNQSYFIKTFKHHAGMTPAEYRG